MTNSLDRFASGFASFLGPVVRGTQSIGDAFQQMAQRIGNSLINQGLTGIGNWLGGALGLGGGGSSNGGGRGGLLGLGGFLGFLDGGGRIGANQWGVVGERRPEIVTGPANVIGGAETARIMNGSSTAGTVNINVNVEGANGDDHVRTLVQQGVQVGLESYDRRLPDRVQSIRSDPYARR
jgi:hypothetical protein